MGLRKKNAILAIDCQVDFTNPSGSLFVPGADEDSKRIAKFILDNKDEIDHISATMDAHHLNSIFHPSFWKGKDGNAPAPFTAISSKDVRDGKWSARFFPQEALKYIEALEAQGDMNIIWPFHCLIGSKGSNIDEIIFEAIKSWEQIGHTCNYITKGTYRLSEHYGIFISQVAVSGVPETDLNLKLLKTLEEYQNLYLVGQAKNFCVLNSLKQLLKYAPNFSSRIIVLEDCMSSVSGFDGLGDDIFEQAKKSGVRFSTSTKERLGNAQNIHSLV